MMRKNKISIILIIILFTGYISCEKENENLDQNKIFLNREAKSLVNADNEFGFNLFKQLNLDSENNICMSPFSVSMALGMVYNGARNKTREAMEETLGVAGLSLEDINGSYRDLISALQTNDPKVLMEIANSIWSRQGFEVEQEFIDLNINYFDAEVGELDFTDPGALDIINGWVADKTHDNIISILDEIPPDAVMYLINAIYFKGIWKYEFDVEKTMDNVFTLTNNEEIMVPTMSQKGSFNYFVNEIFSSIGLAYGSGNFSMHILVPNNGKNVDDIVESLDNESWSNLLEGYTETEDVNIFIPRFKFEYEKSLNDELKELGMAIAFTNAADYTGINKNGNLLISDVMHKTFIELNEEGTEAAAVSSVEISLTSVDGIYFMALKPFIFIIREKSSNAVLFIGKVMNPLLN